MHIVDTRGALCPQPLILTKRAIDALADGVAVTVLYDNETAKSNLLSFLAELNLVATESTTPEGLPAICFTTQGGAMPANAPSEEAINCPIPTPVAKSGGYVVAISSNVMGTGDDKLGTILMRAFINTLPEASSLPSHILLYNSGIKLALEGMDTVATLQQLVKDGVKVIACGTCLDYYEVKEQLAVGTVGNMFVIAEAMIQAHHVVKP